MLRLIPLFDMPTQLVEHPDWPPEKIAAARTIQRLMDFWQIEPAELRSVDLPLPRPAAPQPARARYRHPVSGETWDGQGSQPQWLRQALLKEGYLVEELRLPADALVDTAAEPRSESTDSSAEATGASSPAAASSIS